MIELTTSTASQAQCAGHVSPRRKLPHFFVLDTPAGPFRIGRRCDGTIVTEWVRLTLEPERKQYLMVDREVRALVDRLDAYFAGERIDFYDVPTPPATTFQTKCWRACRSIPFGTTVSYAELAVHMGYAPHAARAIGQAMRRNPQPVITPCHRVLAKAGKLHGYAGSSLAGSPALCIKQSLLRLEQ